jgi:predicted RNA binding protein YcfA (HicA-like mRNA interferase family)
MTMLRTFKEVRFYLEAQGFREITQLGSHAKFIKRETGGAVRTCILPHYVELAPAVVFSLLRQAGLVPDASLDEPNR